MILIQSDSTKTIPHHFDAACAYYGAIELFEKVKLVTIDELGAGQLDLLINKYPTIGSVDFMHTVFSRLNFQKSPTVQYYSDSPYQIINLGIIRNLFANNHPPKFIKPVIKKLFGGFVADSDNIKSLNGFSDNVEIIVAEPFRKQIISEFRIYVHNNKIIDSRNYSGFVFTTPNYDFIQRIIETNKNFPCAYTIDVAIFDDGENVVIEFDDMWAVGNYGVDNAKYLEMLIDRYNEILKSK